jgi:hypothetical protein
MPDLAELTVERDRIKGIIRFRKNISTGTTPPDRNISRLVGWRRNLEKLANKRQ